MSMNRFLHMKSYLKIAATIITLFAIAIATSACSSSQDRGGGFDLGSTNSQFDEVVDAEEVTLVRNVNDFPNFVLICHDGNAYVAARSRIGDAGPQTTVMPDPQRQGECS